MTASPQRIKEWVGFNKFGKCGEAIELQSCIIFVLLRERAAKLVRSLSGRRDEQDEKLIERCLWKVFLVLSSLQQFAIPRRFPGRDAVVKECSSRPFASVVVGCTQRAPVC